MQKLWLGYFALDEHDSGWSGKWLYNNAYKETTD